MNHIGGGGDEVGRFHWGSGFVDERQFEGRRKVGIVSGRRKVGGLQTLIEAGLDG